MFIALVHVVSQRSTRDNFGIGWLGGCFEIVIVHGKVFPWVIDRWLRHRVIQNNHRLRSWYDCCPSRRTPDTVFIARRSIDSSTATGAVGPTYLPLFLTVEAQQPASLPNHNLTKVNVLDTD